MVNIFPTARHRLSPLLYSIFLETEINFGGEGGLLAELVSNRDFETLGRGHITGQHLDARPTPRLMANTSIQNFPGSAGGLGTDPHEPLPDNASFAPWAAIGGASLSIDNSTAPFETNPHVLRMSGPKGAGASNPGYWGIGLRLGVSYRLSLYAANAAESAAPLSASLMLGDAEAGRCALSVPPASSGWVQLSCTISLSGNVHLPNAGSLLLRLPESGNVALDSVSLTPSDAVAGLFRRDIFEALSRLTPGFVRAPGGNYLEGHGQRTRWNWKETLGPSAARRGHYNSAWGYWVTDSLGLYELLLLCELLGSQAQMSVYTGFSMGAAYVPLNESAVYAQDAVDMLEFANGANTTVWGAKRAAMGHAAPFGLRRLEVGNEEYWMTDYAEHYQLITSAIWNADPSVTVVASGRWRCGGSDSCVVGNPCLTGQRCDAWDDHYYRSPDEMAALGSRYDDYNRSWPRVFVGEFAANGGSRRTIQAAVAEAVFMLGFEANADVVESSSFAPLLNNVDGTQWAYNLLNFNATALFGLPSYYAQQMFSSALGTTTLATSSTGGDTTWAAVAQTYAEPSTEPRAVVVKLANYGAAPLPVTLALDEGFGARLSAATASVLTGPSAEAENTLEAPEAVVPAPLPLALAPAAFSLSVPLPPWSVAVVRLTLGPTD